jgi:hypothetical protein
LRLRLRLGWVAAPAGFPAGFRLRFLRGLRLSQRGRDIGRGLRLGIGEVDLSAISSENVTVMRSGGGCALARRRQRQRQISAAWPATAIARAMPSSFERPGAEGSRIVTAPMAWPLNRW